MEFSCNRCDASIMVDNHLPFGEEAVCPHCHTHFEIEYDYVGGDYELIFYLIEKPQCELDLRKA
jgi:hypothetical protein